MSDHYVLNPDHSIRPVPLEEWAEWFESLDNRRVAWTEFNGIEVSTVFLGIDHRFLGEGPPLVFETLVFADWGDMDGHMERTSTWDEALKAHSDACAMVRRSMIKVVK